MKVGKLPAEFLEHLLNSTISTDPRILIGPKVGEDAAVISQQEGKVLVAKTDPITFATDEIGWYSVHVNANDIAATGAKPRWFLATLLIPASMEESAVTDIFNQINAACQTLGVSLVGGHTEITYDIPRPIVMGAMLGEANEDDLTPTSGAEVGDRVLVTKGIAIEGTAILARESGRVLSSCGVTSRTIKKASDYLHNPGISVIQEAQAAQSAGNIHCMHDPTEGGLLTGIREIASASGLGIRIKLESIPVLNETHEICHRLGLNPLGLLASGALLITLPAPDVRNVINSITMLGCEVSDIGEITPLEQGMVLVTNAGDEDLPEFSRDELARFLSS